MCFAEQATMYDATNLSPLGLAHCKRDLGSFEDACRPCEIALSLTRSQARRLEERLFFDKSKKGSRGRSLEQPFPELNLLKGDRVEPSDSVPDVADLCRSDAVRINVSIWRPSLETSYKHRCPILGAHTGLSAMNLGIDWLHTLSLGVFRERLCVVCSCL